MKIQWSGIGVTDGRGSLGSVTYARNQGGAYQKQRTTAGNPSTPARDFYHAVYANLCAWWQSITEEERQLWNSFEHKSVKQNILANNYRLSGFNYFCQVNWMVFLLSNPPVTVPPLPIAPIEPSKVTQLNFSPTALNFSLSFGNNSFIAGPDDYVFFAASASVSPGISYQRNNFLIIAVADPSGDLSNVDLISDYLLAYPAPVTGKKVFLKIFARNYSTGVKSQTIFFGGLVS